MKYIRQIIGLIPVAIAIVFVLPVTADETRMIDYSDFPASMAQTIETKMQEEKIPGLAIAVVDDQNIIWSQGFGVRDKDTQQPVDADTRFRAGSITKVFTALAIMQLAEQAKLNITDPLANHLPGFSINSRFGNTDDITLSSVLSHTSGLPSQYVEGMWTQSVPSNNTPYKKLAAHLKNGYVTYPAGTTWSYSNVGMSLLGGVIDNVSGLTYQDYVAEHILKPLDMNRSEVAQNLTGDNSAASYSVKSRNPVIEATLRDTPAGGLNTTVHDLARFIQMVNAQGSYRKQSIIRAASLKAMFEKPELANSTTPSFTGLGWVVDNSGRILGNGQQIVSHDGGTIGHNSRMVIAPDAKLGVVVIANTWSEAVAEISDIALQRAYSLKTGTDIEQPEEPQTNCAIADQASLAGFYVLPEVGLVELIFSKNKWKVKALGLTMTLKPTANGLYRLQYKWLGLFPTKLDDLKDARLCFSSLNQRTRLTFYYKGQPHGMAQKVRPGPLNPAWQQRLGKYKITTAVDFFTAMEMPLDSELVYEKGLLIMRSGSNATVLTPVDDQNAIINGYGSSLGETVTARLEGNRQTLHHSGVTLEKQP